MCTFNTKELCLLMNSREKQYGLELGYSFFITNQNIYMIEQRCTVEPFNAGGTLSMRTPFGPTQDVLIREVSLFQ